MSTSNSRRIQFDSTALAAAAYDGAGGLLELDFCDGSRYLYSGIKPDVYGDLLRAKSKGSYFNRYIRGRFPHVILPSEN